MKLAGSIAVSFSAIRQSSELPAKQIIASVVSTSVRVRDSRRAVTLRHSGEGRNPLLNVERQK